MISSINIKSPIWWGRLSILDCNLTVLAAVAFFSWVMLTSGFAVELATKQPGESMPLGSAYNGTDIYLRAPELCKDTNDICLTPECIHTASRLLKNMNPKVDPCDDFFQFACGEVNRTTRVPDDKSFVTIFSSLSDQVFEQLRETIETPITPDDIKPFKLIKNFYKACMNKPLIEQTDGENVKKIMKEMGGWPLIEGENWNEETFDWKESVYTFYRLGYRTDIFLDFSVGQDPKNSTRRVIKLDQAFLGLSRGYLIKGLEDKMVSEYYKYNVDIAILFGADREKAEKELKQSVEFEIALANISLPSEERRNETNLYNPMTIPELQKHFPTIPWATYFRRLLPQKIDVKPDEVAIVNVPSFIKNLEALISNTPKRVQANYALSRAATGSVLCLSEKFRKRHLQYISSLSGRTKEESRWKKCIDIISGSSLELPLGSLYVRKFFKEDAKRDALDMVHRIQNQMVKILQTVDWMDEKTRLAALEKVKAMSNYVGYPDELLDDSILEKYFENLEIEPHDYLSAFLNKTRFEAEYRFGCLRELVNKSEWSSHANPDVVNAFYSSYGNSFDLPAGILQGVFFNNLRPRYMNFGAIGFIIGHEITHGFDDGGRQFDKNGNLMNWWQEETKNRYLEKASCILQQYGNYTVSQINQKLNSINILDENISDNGGIKIAYQAYNAWVDENGPEKRLPGLQMFSPHQLFWMSAANIWCTVYKSEYLRNRLIDGHHAPGEFRVIGPFSNQPEFSRDFKCPAGSKMNPSKKCAFW